MAFDLTKYVDADAHTAVITLPGTDEVLTVTYLPRKLSTAALARAEREEKAGLQLAPRDGLVNTLDAILKGWDATDGGNPLPLTRDVLESLPDELLARILDGVLGDAPKASPKPRRR